MSKFTFALPDGKFFTLTGPADATIAQAERIFLEQLAAGAFVGLRPGDTLESFRTELIRFTQSRLDRGTAGTADLPILAITNEGTISALPPVRDVPIDNPVTPADYVNILPFTQPVGSLSPTQVQAVAAQIAAAVDQPANVISQKGIGKYGFSPQNLEDAGYLKPGTACKFLCEPNTPGYKPLPADLETTYSGDGRFPEENC